ncbi:MAG: GNAT family N-acetyltransferase [Anaerolineae bacterium]|nr:GNAT family N-acetyltransferase [Anaerolineae bacterium]
MRGLPFSDPEVRRQAHDILAQVNGDPDFLTLTADLSTLAERCRFATGDRGALAARYMDLPFAAVSFHGEGLALRRALSDLLDAGEPCYTLVAAEQRAQLSAVAAVLEVVPEWQMVHQGDPLDLDPGDALSLSVADLPAMRALAVRGEMHAFKERALESGPYFGVWRDGSLVSMAGTRLQVAGIAEIGNVVTDPAYRRRGLAQMALAATTLALYERASTVLLHVVETNQPALALYAALAFEPRRMMYLVCFALRA